MCTPGGIRSPSPKRRFELGICLQMHNSHNDAPQQLQPQETTKQQQEQEQQQQMKKDTSHYGAAPGETGKPSNVTMQKVARDEKRAPKWDLKIQREHDAKDPGPVEKT